MPVHVAWLVIVPTAVHAAGVFGMNFEQMPLLHQPWGFWGFAALCVVSGVGMLGWFKRRGWL